MENLKRARAFLSLSAFRFAPSERRKGKDAWFDKIVLMGTVWLSGKHF